jgi:hypothetical protein
MQAMGELGRLELHVASADADEPAPPTGLGGDGSPVGLVVVPGTGGADGPGSERGSGTGFQHGSRTVPGTAADDPGGGAVIHLTAQPLRLSQRAMVFANHWVRMIRAAFTRLAEKHGKWWLGLAGEKPPSIREHFRWVHSRAWLPEGYDGVGWLAAGFIYGYTIGALFVTLGNAISALHKPLRFVLFLLFGVLPVIVLVIIHH